MIAFERRACAVLYNLLRSSSDDRPWLLPVNVCADVAATFGEVERAFHLVDVVESSFEIDIDACIARIQERTGGYAGVVFVRPYGSDGDRTVAFDRMKAAQSDLFIIDDKCLCRPDVDGLALSALADVTLFSTGPTKYANVGSGGFAHLASSTAYRRHRGVPFEASALAEMQRRCKAAIASRTPYEGSVAGWLDLRQPETGWDDYRRRALEACAVSAERKRALNSIYERMLPLAIQLPAELQNWRFNIFVPEATRLISSIFEAGLFASRHYAPLGGAFGRGRFPVAERIHDRIVNLFNDLHYDEESARRTAEIVLRHLDAC